MIDGAILINPFTHIASPYTLWLVHETNLDRLCGVQHLLMAGLNVIIFVLPHHIDKLNERDVLRSCQRIIPQNIPKTVYQKVGERQGCPCHTVIEQKSIDPAQKVGFGQLNQFHTINHTSLTPAKPLRKALSGVFMAEDAKKQSGIILLGWSNIWPKQLLLQCIQRHLSLRNQIDFILPGNIHKQVSIQFQRRRGVTPRYLLGILDALGNFLQCQRNPLLIEGLAYRQADEYGINDAKAAQNG